MTQYGFIFFSGHNVNNIIIPAWLHQIESMQTRKLLTTAPSSANFGGIYGKIRLRNLFPPRKKTLTQNARKFVFFSWYYVRKHQELIGKK